MSSLPSRLPSYIQFPTTLRKIAEVTLTSPGTAITFTGLDLKAYKYFVILFNIKNTSTTSANSIYLYINNDTTSSHYYCQCLDVSGTTVSASYINTALITVIPAGTTQSLVGEVILSISPDNYPIAMCISGTGVVRLYGWKYTYATVTNVTRIDIQSFYNMDAGSNVIIFGVG
jgi:hypothetical protein